MGGLLCNRDGNLCLFDIASGVLRQTLGPAAYEVAVAPDSKTLTIVRLDADTGCRRIHCWDFAGERAGKERQCPAVSFAPNGALLAALQRDGDGYVKKVRLHDAAPGGR